MFLFALLRNIFDLHFFKWIDNVFLSPYTNNERTVQLSEVYGDFISWNQAKIIIMGKTRCLNLKGNCIWMKRIGVTDVALHCNNKSDFFNLSIYLL
jgi:hypothetical protein